MKPSAAALWIISLAAWMPAAADCTASAIEKPKYPPIALNARVSGLVVARFHVDAAGVPQEIQIEGPRILAPSVNALIQRSTFPSECNGQDLESKFRFRLDAEASAVTFNAPNEFIIAAGPQPIICVLRSGARRREATADPALFESHPASAPYRGPFLSPKPGKRLDPSIQKLIEEAARRGPNFAGNYSLVRFQIGNGPIGALVVDLRSGSTFRLPKEVVREDYFIPDTSCLERFMAVRLPDEASPLSFRLDSELLIVRRCVPTGFEKGYFRWHRNQWTLLQRVSSPPPPPRPGH